MKKYTRVRFLQNFSFARTTAERSLGKTNRVLQEARVFIFSMALLFAALSVHAVGQAQAQALGQGQQGWGFGGFTGPGAFNPPEGEAQGFPGQQGFGWSQGFAGQFTTVSVSQVYSYPNKAPAILRGNIVSWLGGDRYLFRDASGDIMIKIKHDRWWGQTVGPNDTVELGGELKRDKKTWMINYFDAKMVRKVQ